MAARGSVQTFWLMVLSVLVVGCADMQVLNELADEFQLSSRPRAEYLNEKCPKQEKSLMWTKDCWEWKTARDEAAVAKRRSEEAVREAVRKAEREAELAARREQEEQELRKVKERELAAAHADEREGYKHLSFEEFALDAAKMQGAKIALYGIYVGKGQRLAYNQLAALMWTERAHETRGGLIPLVTSEATRDSRAMLLRCDASPIGCSITVRGRVRMLTLRNAFGVESREFGVVVERVRSPGGALNAQGG